MIAESISRIFFRNALNYGLPAIVCPAAARAIQPGEAVSVDLERNLIHCAAGEFAFPPFSTSIMGVIQAGGLVEYVKQRLGNSLQK